MCSEGSFRVYYFNENGEKVNRLLKEGEGVHLKPGVFHQFEPLEEGAELTESSTFHDDLDVDRLEPSDEPPKYKCIKCEKSFPFMYMDSVECCCDCANYN